VAGSNSYGGGSTCCILMVVVLLAGCVATEKRFPNIDSWIRVLVSADGNRRKEALKALRPYACSVYVRQRLLRIVKEHGAIPNREFFALLSGEVKHAGAKEWGQLFVPPDIAADMRLLYVYLLFVAEEDARRLADMVRKYGFCVRYEALTSEAKHWQQKNARTDADLTVLDEWENLLCRFEMALGFLVLLRNERTPTDFERLFELFPPWAGSEATWEPIWSLAHAVGMMGGEDAERLLLKFSDHIHFPFDNLLAMCDTPGARTRILQSFKRDHPLAASKPDGEDVYDWYWLLVTAGLNDKAKKLLDEAEELARQGRLKNPGILNRILKPTGGETPEKWGLLIWPIIGAHDVKPLIRLLIRYLRDTQPPLETLLAICCVLRRRFKEQIIPIHLFFDIDACCLVRRRILNFLTELLG